MADGKQTSSWAVNEGPDSDSLTPRESLADQLSRVIRPRAKDDVDGEDAYIYDTVVPDAISFSVIPTSAIGRVRAAVPTPRVGKKMVSKDEMSSIIGEVEALLPELPADVLSTILSFEMGDAASYNTAIRGGSGGKYIGLFQFFHIEKNAKGNYAWGAARQELARRGIALPPLSSGWDNAYYSTLAAAGLALANKRVIESKAGRKAVRSWTPIVFYAAHQQGAGYVIKAIQSGSPGPLQGKQSGKSVAAILSDLQRSLA